MEMFLPRMFRGPKVPCRLAFTLYFEFTFRHFALFPSDSTIALGLHMPGTCSFSTKTGYAWRLHYTISECVQDVSRPPSGLRRHPYYQLASFLNCISNRPLVPDAVIFALTPNRAALAAKVASNNRVRQEFITVVRELIGGSTRILVSSTERTKMEMIGGGPSLYGLTAIFPWAIDLLSRRPNCLMMDGTFNCCRPYVLIVLHAIFANESIPIAFALSPSETTDSYVRLYRHLSEVRAQFPESIDEQPLPSSIEAHDGVFVEHHSRQAIDRNDEDVGDMPERGSFEDVRDMAEPEEDPIASVDDQEARDEVMSEAGRDPGLWEFLRSIPLVTDQGTALRSFVRRFELTWKLCHRHIIESVGANGPIGFWVSHILRCYSIEEYNFVRGMVLQQMATLEGHFPKEGSAFDTLQRLLGNLQDDHPLSDRRTWALWERLGCPRTTNSIESVHGHLNFDVRERNSFVERLVVVIGHLRQRYETRNQWRDRSLQRHAEDCFPSQNRRTGPVLPPRQRFFLAMHNAFLLTRPVRREFPSEDPSHMIMSSCERQLTDAKLPSSWVVRPTTAPPTGTVATTDTPLVFGDWVSFIPLGTTQVVHWMYVNTSPDGTLSLLSPTGESLDHVPRSGVTFLRHRDEGPQDLSTMLPLHRTRTMGNREMMIWDLAWRYHCRFGQVFWALHGARIFTRFVELAHRWNPERPAGPFEPLILPNLLAWEMDCDMYVAQLQGSSWPRIVPHRLNYQ
jgi:hypothetical protein